MKKTDDKRKELRENFKRFKAMVAKDHDAMKARYLTESNDKLSREWTISGTTLKNTFGKKGIVRRPKKCKEEEIIRDIIRPKDPPPYWMDNSVVPAIGPIKGISLLPNTQTDILLP